MRFAVVTLFPEIVWAYAGESLLKRAQKRGLLSIFAINPRDYSSDLKHRKIDDRPYGGGPGMVLQAEPVLKAVLFALKRLRRKPKPLVILLEPSGRQFDAACARRFAFQKRDIIFIAGRYEGVDARVKTAIKSMGLKIYELSLGPFVLTGGELPALVMIDAISRYIPGVLGEELSREENRYGVGVPVYTRPEVLRFRGRMYRVPRVLLSGNHTAIEEWRMKHARLKADS
jgi:tRNA (guanine37-N1)-methyltransferase